MPHFAIPPAGTPAFDAWLAESLRAPRAPVLKAPKPERKPAARREPDTAEPVQRPGEDWISFSRRWDRSPFGRAKRAEADALNATVGAELRAEALRDARQADSRGRWGQRLTAAPAALGPISRI